MLEKINHAKFVAGIKEYYTPDELLNTQVSIVANLKPAKIMGIKSEGYGFS